MEWLELLNFVLIPLTGIVTWLVARRKRDNDFLCELQKSINMLSGENHKLMIEVVGIRKENIELKITISETNAEVVGLRKENAELKTTINDLNTIINDLNNKLENVTRITTRRNEKVGD